MYQSDSNAFLKQLWVLGICRKNFKSIKVTFSVSQNSLIIGPSSLIPVTFFWATEFFPYATSVTCTSSMSCVSLVSSVSSLLRMSIMSSLSILSGRFKIIFKTNDATGVLHNKVSNQLRLPFLWAITPLVLGLLLLTAELL